MGVTEAEKSNVFGNTNPINSFKPILKQITSLKKKLGGEGSFHGSFGLRQRGRLCGKNVKTA